MVGASTRGCGSRSVVGLERAHELSDVDRRGRGYRDLRRRCGALAEVLRRGFDAPCGHRAEPRRRGSLTLLWGQIGHYAADKQAGVGRTVGRLKFEVYLQLEIEIARHQTICFCDDECERKFVPAAMAIGRHQTRSRLPPNNRSLISIILPT